MAIFGQLFGGQKSVEDESSRSSEFPPSEDEKSIADWVKSKVQEVRSTSGRITHEGIWMTNIAYMLGFDSVYYDTATRQFKVVGQGSNYLRRDRIHINKILPRANNRLARLCKNPPRFDTRPKSSAQEDKDAARLSLDILMMMMDKEHYREKQLVLYQWLQQCGHAYLKVGYDDQAGELLIDPMTNQPIGFEGDIKLEVISAFEVFPDPLAKTLDEASWVCLAKVRKLDYFRSKYERGGEVKEEDAWLLSAQYEARINSLNNQGPSSSGISETALKNAAIECVYYEKPSMRKPQGRMIAVANGVVLEDKPLPAGCIPLVKFDDILVAGKYYSESLITHARPIQDQYNRVITKRAQWTNLMLTGKYIAAKGSGLSSESLNDQSGEVVLYKPVPNASEPKPMSVPTIPSYAFEEESRLETMMDDLFGINEVSRGQLPASGMPAIGMQLLTEQDDTRIGVIVEKLEESWARVGQIALKYAEKFYKMPRLLKMAGKNREWEVKEFKGDDIAGNTDVIVIRGSALPGSKTLRRQEIMNVYQSGLMGDPNDPNVREKVLQMLEYGDVGELWEDQSLDMHQIKRDIVKIENGEQPPVSELDNHVLHIQEKNRYRKSDKYNTMSPQSQALLQLNIQQHFDILTDIMNPGVRSNYERAEAELLNQVRQTEPMMEEEIPNEMEGLSGQPNELGLSQ